MSFLLYKMATAGIIRRTSRFVLATGPMRLSPPLQASHVIIERPAKPSLAAMMARLAATLAVGVVGNAACGSVTGPSGGSCTPSFSVLPVPVGSIAAATPVGNMSPPFHIIPTDHAGFYLRGTGITLSAPTSLHVTTVRSIHYLASPSRAGQSDFAIYADVCEGYQLAMGHIQTVVPNIQSRVGTNCQTYSSSSETIQSCDSGPVNISFSPGDMIGTVGGASAGGFDFGLYQSSHQNVFVNPSRYSQPTLSAVCPYDPFTPMLRSQIDALMGEPGRPASGEAPLCGTMSVDVAGTARGVWVLQSNPVSQAGDESSFVSLTPHPLQPQSAQTFSFGPSTLLDFDTGLARYPVATSGRVNRNFRDVSADGQIYCYASDDVQNSSYFVRLDGAGVLTIRRLVHARGASPCGADPASWTMDTALAFIR